MTFEAQIREILPKARILLSGLSTDQINWNPSAGSWSIGECLGHLNVTNAQYLAAIEPVVEEAKQTGAFNASKEPKPTWRERFFARALEPPYRLKFKATGAFAPPKDLYVQDEILARWISTHAGLLDLARESADLDFTRIKVVSPVDSRLRFTLAGALAIICAHDRRHLWQAQHIRARIPGAPNR